MFMFGFEKNERENITQAELAAIQGLARDYLEFSDSVLRAVIATGQLEEVGHE
ncbi:type II toxin-antitoxin system RelE/ParE family toxin [Desulfosarcina sp. OttesenSCG-928-B08]|nr:type II toxin-antitoxin system RelE/ParE family toxin [Desulfosarcina sp. OttesenSCG-928-B08]